MRISELVLGSCLGTIIFTLLVSNTNGEWVLRTVHVLPMLFFSCLAVVTTRSSSLTLVLCCQSLLLGQSRWGIYFVWKAQNCADEDLPGLSSGVHLKIRLNNSVHLSRRNFLPYAVEMTCSEELLHLDDLMCALFISAWNQRWTFTLTVSRLSCVHPCPSWKSLTSLRRLASKYPAPFNKVRIYIFRFFWIS